MCLYPKKYSKGRILMSKSRAALTHLWLSIPVLAVIGSLILFTWYPSAFLQFKDTGKFSLLLVITASFAGPALTWFVYKKGKRGLRFDLIVIGLIQMTAIAWGTRALYLNRPYFMVFTVDRFEVLSMRDVDFDAITDPRFLNKPIAGPIRLYASMPKDAESFQRLLKEIMFEGKPDLQFRPEFWGLYTEKQQLALEGSRPLLDLRNARPESVSAIEKLVKNNGGDIKRLNFVPAMMQNGQFAAILDADNGEVIDRLVIDPWVN